MTAEHNIEELRRQYDAASSRAANAERAKAKAGQRLREAYKDAVVAEYAAMGIHPGDKVQIVRGDDVLDTVFFMGAKGSKGWTPAAVAVFKQIKVDGTPSKVAAPFYLRSTVRPIPKDAA